MSCAVCCVLGWVSVCPYIFSSMYTFLYFYICIHMIEVISYCCHWRIETTQSHQSMFPLIRAFGDEPSGPRVESFWLTSSGPVTASPPSDEDIKVELFQIQSLPEARYFYISIYFGQSTITYNQHRNYYKLKCGMFETIQYEFRIAVAIR